MIIMICACKDKPKDILYIELFSEIIVTFTMTSLTRTYLFGKSKPEISFVHVTRQHIYFIKLFPHFLSHLEDLQALRCGPLALDWYHLPQQYFAKASRPLNTTTCSPKTLLFLRLLVLISHSKGIKEQCQYQVSAMELNKEVLTQYVKSMLKRAGYKGFHFLSFYEALTTMLGIHCRNTIY